MLWLALVCALAAQAHSAKLDEGKIVGGYKVDITEHPYQVSLQANGYHDCGGSLLKPDVVLTAAHCTYHFNNEEAITIRAGSSLSQMKNKEPAGGEVVKIVKVHKHPKYKSGPTDYDISVLILEKPFVLSEKIQTIQLISPDYVIEPGLAATVTGWGTQSYMGQRDEFLRAVQVPKVSNEDCNKSYGNISPSMSCYGYTEGKKDACQGDSGGPLVHYINGVPYLSAVVSWGRMCASAGYPGVYAHVQHPEIYSYIVEHAGL